MADGTVRRGRPPDTDPAETRRRIIDAARHEFAAHGYVAATNRTIAAAAGLTTGAVYHHYSSKTELYLAVYIDVHDRVYGEFTATAAGLASFIAMFDAVLDAAAAMNAKDPTMAAFIGAARVDRRRHAELAAAIPDDRVRRARFFGELIDVGMATGEIGADRRAEVAALVDALIVGLNDSGSDDQQRQLATISSIKAMMRTFVRPLDSAMVRRRGRRPVRVD